MPAASSLSLDGDDDAGCVSPHPEQVRAQQSPSSLEDDGRVTVVQDASNYAGFASVKAHDARWVRGLLPVNHDHDDYDESESDDGGSEKDAVTHNGRRRRARRRHRTWRYSGGEYEPGIVFASSSSSSSSSLSSARAQVARLSALLWRLQSSWRSRWLWLAHACALVYVLLCALATTPLAPRSLTWPHTATLDLPDTEASLWPYGLLAVGRRVTTTTTTTTTTATQHHSSAAAVAARHARSVMYLDDYDEYGGVVAHVGVLTRLLAVAVGVSSSNAAAAAVSFAQRVALPLTCPTAMATASSLLLSFCVGAVAHSFVALCGVGVALLGALATLVQVGLLWWSCSEEAAATATITTTTAATTDAAAAAAALRTRRAVGDVCAVPFVLYCFCGVVRCGAPLLSTWCVSPLLDAVAAHARSRRRRHTSSGAIDSIVGRDGRCGGNNDNDDDVNDTHDDDDDDDGGDDSDASGEGAGSGGAHANSGSNNSSSIRRRCHRCVRDGRDGVVLRVRWRVWLALPLLLFAVAIVRSVRDEQPQYALLAAARALSCATMLSVVYATWRLTPHAVVLAVLWRSNARVTKPHED